MGVMRLAVMWCCAMVLAGCGEEARYAPEQVVVSEAGMAETDRQSPPDLLAKRFGFASTDAYREARSGALQVAVNGGVCKYIAGAEAVADDGAKSGYKWDVMCARGEAVRSIYVSTEEAENPPRAPIAGQLSESAARLWCSDAVRASAHYPKSVNMHILGYRYWHDPLTGHAEMSWSFTAENAFRQSSDAVALCGFNPGSDPTIQIVSQR